MAVQRNVLLLEVAQLLQDLQEQLSTDHESVLLDITGSAARAVPGAAFCGITTASRDGDVQSIAASNPDAKVIDDIQRRTRQGPCLSAAWEHQIIRVDDLQTETRWPHFAQDALADTTVQSMLCYQLFVDRRTMGALNFFSDRPHAFDADSVEVGLIMATHAATAWSMLARDEQFRSALASRDVIGQAKGVIMERFDIDAIAAFELLKRLSQTSNTPLVDIATALTQRNGPRA